MLDAELEVFKTAIDLRSYAASQEYVLDRHSSCRGSAVMRHQNGDKIVIRRDMDSHWVFFSVRDDSDHGSIIDFVQGRMKLSLGAVRKELRQWIGTPAFHVHAFSTLERTKRSRPDVETDYLKMDVAVRHPYLESERAIPTTLLASERFAGRIRIDARGNAIFPHFDHEGLCGYEIKGRFGFTGFASGGTKALWMSHALPTDNRLVFCESAIDALSVAALGLFPEDRTQYASIGGRVNTAQPGNIELAIRAMKRGWIVAAMDADAPGLGLATVVRDAFRRPGRDDLRFLAIEPTVSKDWNDQLRANRTEIFPHPPFKVVALEA